MKNVNNSLISVIVPIFMIDRCVGLCIESILNQTYKNLEIILVDDGGTDRCAEICDLYASKDKRIKVIHKPNGGLVSARKAGLQHSNGEYVTYVDGDDWIDPTFIEALYSATDDGNVDMVCAGFTRELFSKKAFFGNGLPAGLYIGERLEELWKNMISMPPYYRIGISTYVWNKLFKREILIDCQAAVDNRISIGEDGAVTYPALLKCRSVAVIDNTDYHYRQREDSMLKQSAAYSAEASKLKYLYDYLMKWAEGTPATLNIKGQVTDYILSIALIRAGGRLPHDNYSAFGTDYFDKDIVIYSAGTFGQHLVNRCKESGRCNIVGWIDDDYWEYRRCCLDVDPVESIAKLKYDYVLIATVDSLLAEQIMDRLSGLGVSSDKMRTIMVPQDKEVLLKHLIDVDKIRTYENMGKQGAFSHA